MWCLTVTEDVREVSSKIEGHKQIKNTVNEAVSTGGWAHTQRGGPVPVDPDRPGRLAASQQCLVMAGSVLVS